MDSQGEKVGRQQTVVREAPGGQFTRREFLQRAATVGLSAAALT